MTVLTVKRGEGERSDGNADKRLRLLEENRGAPPLLSHLKPILCQHFFTGKKDKIVSSVLFSSQF